MSTSRNALKFSVNGASRRSLVCAPSAKVTLVPVFSTDSTGKVRKLESRFAHQAELAGFKGEGGQTLSAPVKPRGGESQTLVHLGLGNRDKFSAETWRKALIAGAKSVRSLKTDTVSVTLPEGLTGRKALFGALSLKEVGRLTAETLAMTLYQPNHYKTAAGGHKDEGGIANIVVNAPGLNDAQQRELNAGVQAGAFVGSSINLSRDTANEPPNVCTPSFMAALAQRVADESGGTITCQVFDRAQCKELGMNAFLAVASGSYVEPRFIVLDYTPAQCAPNGPVLGIVGKSVTFDSGGLDIKPADGMRDMKYDMCGGADVIAAIRAIAHLGLPIRVKAFCAATENMTGSNAYRPGDVYVGLDGKSYEIDNTDAEGRLTLVDAISYARKHAGVTHVVDYATLTGAVLVTLGDIAAGVFSTHDEFADQFMGCAKAQGEKAFRMPLFDEFKEMNKSKIADLKNSGGRFGGSSTAALFVLSAAGDLPAVHVDIAGVSFRNREVEADPAGGTAWGVRTLVALAADMAKR